MASQRKRCKTYFVATVPVAYGRSGSRTILGNTKFIAPIIIVISIYLFAGSLIKLCRMNEKLKNTVICALDLLFWLP